MILCAAKIIAFSNHLRTEVPVQDAEDVKGVMGILLEERRQIQEFEYGLLIAMLNETGVKLQDTFLAGDGEKEEYQNFV